MSGQDLSFAHLILILLLCLIFEDKGKYFCLDCSSGFINEPMSWGGVSCGGGTEIFACFICMIIY